MNAATFDAQIDAMTKPVRRAAKPPKKAKTKKVSMTAMATKLIREGKTNAQIYNTLRLTHKLPATKKWYVQWFRAYVARVDAKLATVH